MELSKHFFKLIKFPAPWADFLYVLQLEEYYSREYNQFIKKYWWRRQIQEKDTLVWTSRIKLTAGVSILGFYGVWIAIAVLIQSFWLTIPFIISHIGIPWVVLIVNILLQPLIFNQKKKAIKRAAQHRSTVLKHTHVIAVAGSYGKTTSKNFLVSLLKFTHKVVATPGNINTTIGVAQWLPTLKKAPQILIIEMDAYGPGELREMCEYIKPDSFLLTSIGDQHMARFKTPEMLTKTLLEPLAFVSPSSGAAVIPDSVEGEYDRVHKVGEDLTYQAQSIKSPPSQASSVLQNLAKVLKVVEYFNVPARIVKDEIANLSLPDRRRQLTTISGFQVIDDSYNISGETLTAGLAYGAKIAKREQKEYIVITAGIPEAGTDSQLVHQEMAQILNKYADKVIFLDSIYASLVVEQITKPVIHAKDLRSIQSALKNLSETHSPDEVLVHVFPELTDLSYV